MRLYLCETREEYLRRTPSAPPWEQASALPVLDSIYIHRLPPEQSIYFESVLAHELAHLLYHRFYPVAGNDAWLNEGLADYLGYAFALDRAGFARQAWLDEHVFKQLEGQTIPFDRFFQVDPHRISNTQEVATFYRQGFSVVFMLIEHYGQEQFLTFLRAYRRGDRDVAKALAEAYPTIQNTEGLASVWSLFYGHHE
jgi:aminopeptidase N